MTLTAYLAISAILLALIAVYFVKSGNIIREKQKNYSESDKLWAWTETYIQDCMAVLSTLTSTACFLLLIYEYLTN